MLAKIFLLGILVYQLIIHLTSEFADWPETVFFSWLISKGYVPYRDFFDNHNPGVYYVNGLLFRLYGVDYEILRWEMALIMMVNTVGVYRIAKLIEGPNCALVAAAVFVLLELQMFGNGIWFEQFVLPFFLYAVHYLLRNPLDELTARRCFVLGLIFGLAAIFKQQTVFVFLGTAILIGLGSRAASSQQRGTIKQKLLMLALGSAGPLAVHFLALAILGAGEKFLYGTVYMPLFDWTAYRLPGLGSTARILLWVCVASVQLWLGLKFKDTNARFSHWVIFTFFFSSLFFNYPYHGRVHLIPAAAFISISAAQLAFKIWQYPWTGLILAAFLITATVNHIKAISFDRAWKFFSPTKESDETITWIQQQTSRQDTIYVVNGLHFYVFADRPPATYNSNHYWWLMHGSYGVENIIGDLMRTRPTYVVVAGSETNPWQFTRPMSAPLIDFISMNYGVVPGVSAGWVIMKRKEN